MKPMEMTRIGTVQDPIPIYSLVSPGSYRSRPTKEDKREMGVREDQRKRFRVKREMLSHQSLANMLGLSPSSVLSRRRSLGSNLQPRTSLIYSSPNVTLDVQVSQPILTIPSGCS